MQSDLKICLECERFGKITAAEYQIKVKTKFLQDPIKTDCNLCLEHLIKKREWIINDAKIIKTGAMPLQSVIAYKRKTES